MRGSAMFKNTILSLVLLTPSLLFAGVDVICDVTCTPDPGSGGYSGAVGDRTLPRNGRGTLSVRFPVMQTGPATADTIDNLGSQSYNHAIPILHLPGRNGMDLNLVLYYNSHVWGFSPTSGQMMFNLDRDWPSYGFNLNFGYLEYSGPTNPAPTWVLTEPDGTKRILQDVIAQNPPGVYPTWHTTPIYQTADSSFITYDSSAHVLTYKNGTRVYYQPFVTSPSSTTLFRPVLIEDANGNQIWISYVPGKDQAINQIQDTLGRMVDFIYDGSGHLIQLKQDQTGNVYATFGWNTNYPLLYQFTFSSPSISAPAYGTPLSVLTTCTYPSGTGYKFTYGDWGIVTRIDKLSSNGTTRSYKSYNFPSASAGALDDAPAYTTETVSNDGVSQAVWNYFAAKDSNGEVTSYSVTDPAGTSTVTTIISSLSSLWWAPGLVQQIQTLDSNGVPLRTVANDWEFIQASQAVPGNALLQRQTMTLNDSGQQSKTEYSYDVNGNVTQMDEYDFGLQLTRRTSTSYLPPTSNHILNLPSQILVRDANNNIVSHTDFAYDSTPLTPVTGAWMHDDNYSAPRGNLTSVTRYANAAAGSGAITQSKYYDSLGNLRAADTDCCTQEQWNYSSTTDYSYPDSVVRGPVGTQLTTSYGYDYWTGLNTQITDENLQTTNTSYDSMNRVHTVDQPSGLSNPSRIVITNNYDDSSLSPSVTRSSTADSAVQVTTFDGLDHVIETELLNGGTAVSTVTTSYDALGRPSKVSNPFGPGQTPVYTMNQYDALGRPFQVSPPSGGSYSYGFYGNYKTTTDPAGKVWADHTDALGRTIEADEPGFSLDRQGSGSVAVSGNLQSIPGGAGSGSVTIQGGEQSYQWCDPDEEPTRQEPCPGQTWYYDNGYVSITVNGYTASTSYGRNSNPIGIAAWLASGFNSDGNSPVWASASGSTVYFTAKGTGAATNFSLSSNAVSTDVTGFFYGSGFWTSQSASTLTGGYDGITDSGTATITVNNCQANVPYGASTNSNPSAVASALASALNSNCSQWVTASAPSTMVNITSVATGWDANYSLSTSSSTSQGGAFGKPSFATAPSGSSLTGGRPAGNYIDTPNATYYTFDVLDDLTNVEQGAQRRVYIYDSLGRTMSVTTPESGTTNFSYLTSGGVQCSTDPTLACQRTDARTITALYNYDGLNRLQSITYINDPSSAPSVSYGHDAGGATAFALGRLTSVTSGAVSESYTYDSVGRVKSVTETVNGTTYPLQYSYWPDGQLQNITYPSGRVVTHSYDTIGRLNTIASSGNTYLTIPTTGGYTAGGQVLAATFGNNVQGTFGYNDHLQLSSLRYAGNTSTDLLNLTYSYNAPNGGNNSQIQAITAYTSPGVVDNFRSTSFAYDDWSRLTSARTASLSAPPSGEPPTWALAWDYDRYGNRLDQRITGGTASVYTPQLNIDPSTNHVSTAGFGYDPSGNMISDGGNSYIYDAESRLAAVNGGASTANGATYTYDGGGLRITRTVGYQPACSSKCPLVQVMNTYVYSGTKVIAEYGLGGLNQEYVYDGSKVLATIANGVVTYSYPDQLSTRVEADVNGAVTRTYGHLPFGDDWYETGASGKWKFTTYERDRESSLDYAMFRYRSPVQGRFLSPDPARETAVDVLDPQSWNSYAYVSNSPVDSIDPDGTCTIIVAGVDTPNNSFINALAAVNGFGVVYPYGAGKSNGVLSVLGRDLGLESSGFTQAVAAADGDPNGIQLVGHSGGAQVIATGIGSLPANLQAQITAIVGVSPGLGFFSGMAGLPRGTWSLEIFHGHGGKDFFATLTSAFRKGDALPCSHNFMCEYTNLPVKTTRKFTSCAGTPQSPIFGGGAGSGGGLSFNPGGWMFYQPSWIMEGQLVYGAPEWVWVPGGFGPPHHEPFSAPF